MRPQAASDINERSAAADAVRREEQALRYATTRARSARHERRSIAIRTQRAIDGAWRSRHAEHTRKRLPRLWGTELRAVVFTPARHYRLPLPAALPAEMARSSLSLRLARSSAQSTALTGLTRALAAQAREDAAAQLQAEAEDAAAEVAEVRHRLALRQAALRVASQAAVALSHGEVAQRVAACEWRGGVAAWWVVWLCGVPCPKCAVSHATFSTSLAPYPHPAVVRAQRLALRRSLHDLSLSSSASAAAAAGVHDARAHAEADFLARHVEPLRGPFAGTLNYGGVGASAFDAADVDAYYAAADARVAAAYATGSTLLPPLTAPSGLPRLHAGAGRAPRFSVGGESVAAAAAHDASALYAADDGVGLAPDEAARLSALGRGAVAGAVDAARRAFAQRAADGPSAEAAAAAAVAGAAADLRTPPMRVPAAAAAAAAEYDRLFYGEDDYDDGYGDDTWAGAHAAYPRRSGGGGGHRDVAQPERPAAKKVRPQGPSPFRTTILL